MRTLMVDAYKLKRRELNLIILYQTHTGPNKIDKQAMGPLCDRLLGEW